MWEHTIREFENQIDELGFDLQETDEEFIVTFRETNEIVLNFGYGAQLNNISAFLCGFKDGFISGYRERKKKETN